MRRSRHFSVLPKSREDCAPQEYEAGPRLLSACCEQVFGTTPVLSPHKQWLFAAHITQHSDIIASDVMLASGMAVRASNESLFLKGDFTETKQVF